MKIIWFIMAFQVFEITVVAIETTTDMNMTLKSENYLKEFIEKFEILVLSTTEQALKVTTQVYRNITKLMSPLLQHATAHITTKYIRTVEETLMCPSNYFKHRKLLLYFRYNNVQIERLRQELQSQHPKFEFHLISNDFYNCRKNLTEFDNLYLKFMLAFQDLSQMLYNSVPHELTEQQSDLLAILNEIEREAELSGKDKLYDEFIEMFLFKNETDEKEHHRLE